MAQTRTPGTWLRNRSFRIRLLIGAGWLVVVLLFASQWYAYDRGHGVGDPFLYYIGWSCYMWGVLTPVALWLAQRYPIEFTTWKRAVTLHVAASLLLTVLQLSLEASLEWLRAGADWPLPSLLRHYLTQHGQVSLITYWVLVGAAQFYRMYDKARKRQLYAAQLEARLAEAQLETLRMQLQPHFLFNSLQAISTLIYTDPQGAEDVLLRLSQLLRASLEEVRVREIPLRRELELLEHYMSIQQRRFGDRLRFEVHVDPGVLECAVPTLVLQPLVENAVRHGIGKHKGSDVVTIRAFAGQERLCLEVSNLAGMLKDTPERLLSRGVGLSNTRRRLAQLYPEGQALDLFNLTPEGVCVRVVIPAHTLALNEDVSERMVAQ